ncbi:MAG: HEAT repeat domain-containing protein [Candidatus Anstonellales archaeon]
MRKYIEGEELAERNISDIFWKCIKLMVEKKEKEACEIARNVGGMMGNLAAEYANAPKRVYIVNMSANRLAYLSAKLFFMAGMKDAFANFLKIGNGSPSIVAGVDRLIKEYHEGVEWLREVMKEDRVSVISLLSKINNEEVEKEFKPELIETAREEIDDVQYMALEALKNLAKKDEDVQKVFIALIDDWDEKVRMLSAEAMQNVKNELLGEQAKKALKEETNKYIAHLLQKIIQYNEGK